MEMADHSSILALRIPMDRGAWQTIVHGGHKELDMTEWLWIAQHMVAMKIKSGKNIKIGNPREII